MQFQLLWPDVIIVDEGMIRIWYFDAVANGECDNDSPEDPVGMAEILQDIGHITLGKMR